jgi:putative peptide zinc metalloprotease protein
MMFDLTLLGTALALRVANGQWAILSPFADRLLAALVRRQAISLMFQSLICLRTDGYLVLSALLGCRDLLQATKLHVRSVLYRLTPAQQARLADSPARDRQVARWYGPGWSARRCSRRRSSRRRSRRPCCSCGWPCRRRSRSGTGQGPEGK